MCVLRITCYMIHVRLVWCIWNFSNNSTINGTIVITIRHLWFGKLRMKDEKLLFKYCVDL